MREEELDSFYGKIVFSRGKNNFVI